MRVGAGGEVAGLYALARRPKRAARGMVRERAAVLTCQ